MLFRSINCLLNCHRGRKANRVLAEITAGAGAGSKDGGLIDQVTRQQGQDVGLARGSMHQQDKDTGSQQQQSSSEGNTRYFSGIRCIQANSVRLPPVDSLCGFLNPHICHLASSAALWGAVLVTTKFESGSQGSFSLLNIPNTFLSSSAPCTKTNTLSV